jgi:hypothetical protein
VLKDCRLPTGKHVYITNQHTHATENWSGQIAVSGTVASTPSKFIRDAQLS